MPGLSHTAISEPQTSHPKPCGRPPRSSQNVGNVLTERSSTRLNQAPGGPDSRETEPFLMLLDVTLARTASQQ